jgi:hypothetical protein
MNQCTVASHDARSAGGSPAIGRAGQAGRRRRAAMRGRSGGVLLAAALLGAVLLATACGGSASTVTTSQDRIQELDAFASCMRSHGEPDFYFTSAQDLPSQGISGDSVLAIMGEYVVGVNPQTSAFQSAMDACKHLLPGGPPKPMTQQQKDEMLRSAACMRSHGYPGYPDPVFRNGGVSEQPLPATIDTSSPQYVAAEKACGNG